MSRGDGLNCDFTSKLTVLTLLLNIHHVDGTRSRRGKAAPQCAVCDVRVYLVYVGVIDGCMMGKQNSNWARELSAAPIHFSISGV